MGLDGIYDAGSEAEPVDGAVGGGIYTRMGLVQYKMSLKGTGWAKRRIANSNARDRKSAPGADAGVSGRQPGNALPSRGACRYLRLGGTDFEAAAVRQAEPRNQGLGAAIHAPGWTPAAVLEKLVAIQLIDVPLPTVDGRCLILPRHTQPEPEVKMVLEKLRLALPTQPPPRIRVIGVQQPTSAVAG